MSDRMTRNARQIMDLASDEATLARSNGITPIHVFQALVKISDSTALQALQAMAVDMDSLKNELNGLKDGAGSPHTTRAFVDEAGAVAQACGDTNIGSAHLLLAVSSETRGELGLMLAKHGINVPGVHRALAAVKKPHTPTLAAQSASGAQAKAPLKAPTKPASAMSSAGSNGAASVSTLGEASAGWSAPVVAAPPSAMVVGSVVSAASAATPVASAADQPRQSEAPRAEATTTPSVPASTPPLSAGVASPAKAVPAQPPPQASQVANQQANQFFAPESQAAKPAKAAAAKAAAPKGATVQTYTSSSAAEPVGAYAHAKRVGNLLFLAGVGPRKKGSRQIPGVTVDEAGRVQSYDIEAQVRSCFENVRMILEEAGSSWANIVDVTVFLTNMDADFQTVNRLWAEYFKTNQPCRTTVEINKLPTPINFEVKVIATVQ